jgi:hypothetical protein
MVDIAKHRTPRIACFISPHGYGHAARAAAVMEAIREHDPTVALDVFTRVPRWFFRDSLSGDFEYHDLLTDIGLAQRTPLEADLPETLHRLDRFLPFRQAKLTELADRLRKKSCTLVVSDISPLGILVAREAGVPSVLVENFTWDWIYEAYLKWETALKKHLLYLREIFDSADLHIQAEPVCCRRNADLTTSPISREMRTPPRRTREKLGIPENSKVVMITMGGIPEQYPFLKQLQELKDIHFIVPGASSGIERHGNLLLLPHHSSYFHPDLVHASDAVIGKVGYSTLAEVYSAGVPFGYIARSGFRESPKLVSFIRRHMKGWPIGEAAFYEGAWLSTLPELLALPRIRRRTPNGAAQAAKFILSAAKV